MPDSTHAPRNVLLVADSRSAAATRLARRLAEDGFRVERVAPGLPTSGLQLASVFLLEAEVSPKLLRSMLGYVQTPVLVLAATRDLAMSVVPLLRSDDDVATLDDTDGLASWRLQRLIDRACGSGPRRLRLDALTTLLSRHAFEQQVGDAVAKLQPGDVVGLLMLDLDRFKMVNDRHGHVAGDRALRRVADVIRARMPSGDCAARLGGDEFALLMRRADEPTVIADARQLLEAIASLELGGPPGTDGTAAITASGGLVFLAPDDRVEDALVATNVANYEAKTEGRGRLVLYRDLVERVERSDEDLKLLHFENSTRLLTERLVGTLASKSRRLIEEANRKADVCALTGVYSRLYLQSQLPREIERARTWCRPLTVALVDVDEFSQYNDQYDYPTGDRVLQTFGEIARDGLRSSDWVGRYGGDEFLFVMPGTTPDAARQVIERIRAQVSERAIESTDGRPLKVTVSAGIVQLTEGIDDAVALIRRASALIHRAKKAGRNRIETEEIEEIGDILD